MFNIKKNNLMKNLSVLKICIMAMVGLSLVACKNNDYEEVPVTKNDIKGNFKAKLRTSQGNNFGEKIIELEAKDSVIIFKEFPIREIVKSVISDPEKAEAALSAMSKIEYHLDYTSKLNSEQNILELDFMPSKITLQIPVDGTLKNTIIDIKADKKGFFVGYDFSLRFAIEADKITVDGVEITPYQPIKYEVPISVKY